MEAVPIPNISADTCVQAFLLNWVARYGIPDDVVADRGAQFTSSLWRRLHELLGIKSRNTTSYKPAANGLVERLHRQLKAALMAREDKTDWVEHLPMVLLGIRTAWRAKLAASPADLTFGTALHLPGEFIEPTSSDFTDHEFLRDLKEQMNKLAPVQTNNHDTNRTAQMPKALDSAEQVFVRGDARAPPLTRPYTGPFRVIRATEKYFEIDLNGKVDRVSIDRLKRAYISEDEPKNAELSNSQAPDSFNQCYEEKTDSDWTTKSRDQTEIPSDLTKENTQPILTKTKKRGRPSKAALAERAREREAKDEDEQQREREREDEYKGRRRNA